MMVTIEFKYRQSFIHDEEGTDKSNNSENLLNPSSTPGNLSPLSTMKEFLSFTIPRQVVFFELGYDLTASNIDANVAQFDATTYGKMLAYTPHAFLHLLNSCIYTKGSTTYIDFFPFFNPKGNYLHMQYTLILWMQILEGYCNNEKYIVTF